MIKSLKNRLSSIKSRCRNPNDNSYHNYGGRGITVCNEWNDQDAFIEWAMANGYEPHLQIERKDNNGSYEPSNCIWTTAAVNLDNRRNSLSTRFTKEELEAIAIEYIETEISHEDTLSKYKISGGSLKRLLNGRAKKYRNQHQAVEIYQYTLNGEFVMKYDSILEAKNQTGVGHISECAKGKRKTAGGYVWTYQQKGDAK